MIGRFGQSWAATPGVNAKGARKAAMIATARMRIATST